MSGLKVGDLIWARMKGYPPWPARIDPPPSVRHNKKWTYFFGTRNHAWTDNTNIQPFEQWKGQFMNSNKPGFQAAVQHLQEYMAEMPEKEEGNSEEGSSSPVDTSLLDKSTASTSSKRGRKKKQPKKESISKDVSDILNSSSKSTPGVRRTQKRGLSESSLGATPPAKLVRVDSASASNGVSSDQTTFHNMSTHIMGMGSSSETEEDELVSFSSMKQQQDHDDDLGVDGTAEKGPTSSLCYGFLGLGIIGSALVKNLIKAKLRLYIWNRTSEKCEKIKAFAEDMGHGDLVTICEAPYMVVLNADVIFSCLGDPKSAKEIATGNCGVIHMNPDLSGKGYVEMTGLDPDTSNSIRESITSLGGRYLEVQFQGSRSEAERGCLVLLCAGDKSLFSDCQTCLEVMSKDAFYFNEPGYATKANLILQLIKGIALAGLVEGLALADRSGISTKDFMYIFKLTTISNSYLENKADLIMGRNKDHVEQALEHMQKDIKLAVKISDKIKQPLVMGSTANEVYKHARRLGYDGRDASCVYVRTRN